MKQKQILGAILAIAILSLIIAFYLQKNASVPVTVMKPSSSSNESNKATSTPPEVLVGRTVAKYVSQNLTALSPVKSTTLRTTKIQVSSGTGVIEYTDGKTAYKADFTYQVDGGGNISIPSFKLQK